MSIYILDDKVLIDSDSAAINVNCCCCPATSFSADFTFSYQDNPVPPIGHAFSGSGNVSGTIYRQVVSQLCCGNGFNSVLVTVTEHGLFSDEVCVPDAPVNLNVVDLCYDSDTGLWSVTLLASMDEHQTVCGPESWPAVGVGGIGGGTFTSPATFPLLPGSAGFSGSVNISVS